MVNWEYTFKVLEYCKPEDLKKTEQKYIDLLKPKPKYNLSKAAGNPGLRDTESSEQEQKHIDLLKPKCNVLKTADNPDIRRTEKTEQKYIDHLKSKHNTLKTADNPTLRRTNSSKQLMRDAKLGKPRSDETKAKMSANRIDSKTVRVTNDKTGDMDDMPSIRRAAIKIGISHTYLTTHIKNQGFYMGKGYKVNLINPGEKKPEV